MNKFRLKVRSKQFIVLGVTVLFVFLMMDLNTRLSELFQQNARRDQIVTEVIGLKETEASLYTQMAFATSDLAVENWAREEGHMARPGDEVVIPLAPQNIQPTPTPFKISTPIPVTNLEIWKALFFGR